MKTYITLAILSIFILAGCSSTKSTAEYDDVYYSTREKKKKEKKKNDLETQVANPDYYISSDDASTDYYIEDYEAGDYVQYEDEQPYYSESETETTPQGTNYITNNYYDGYGGAGGDYYDYSYASRINRFYGPYMGFNYYAPCYTGFYYDPWYWDYYWYRPSWYFSFNWGWGWGYPYYYPYNNYWYGYNTGYWNGYWDGYYASNYYGYSNNGYYYGPRTTRSSTNSPYSRSNGNYAVNTNNLTRSNYLERTSPVLADASEAIRTTTKVPTGPGRSSTNTTDRNPTGKPTASKVNASLKTVNDDNNVARSSNNIDRTRTSTAIAGGAMVSKKDNPQNVVTKTPQKKTETKPRYTYKKPASETKTRYQPGQSLQSTKQTRPTQKYNKPASAATQNKSRLNYQKSTSGRNAQTYTKPTSTYNRSYTKPTRYNNKGGSSQSTRSSKSYTTPSRTNTKSYRQPSKSTRTYSTPGRSVNSRSYSSPSRSSSSGGSKSSGRSGGGRR